MQVDSNTYPPDVLYVLFLNKTHIQETAGIQKLFVTEHLTAVVQRKKGKCFIVRFQTPM